MTLVAPTRSILALPPVIVAVSGGSGAGKTRFVRALAARWPGRRVGAIAEDDYYFSLPAASRHDPASFNFDEPAAKDHALLARHLQALKSGSAIGVPRYDFTTHERLAAVTALAGLELALLDGIHLLCSESLRACYDLAVYLDVPDEIRLARRLERDRTERGRDRASILAQYQRWVRPMHALHTQPSVVFADIAIDNETLQHDFDGAVAAVSRRIEALLAVSADRVALEQDDFRSNRPKI
jgi:uridine kinase